MQPRFILSPCGTSILTNGATEAQRKSLSKYANAQTLAEIPEGDRPFLEARIDEVRSKLAQATVMAAAQMSAELNGIIKLSEGQLQGAADSHCLLCTDTWLGETTARLVESWLRQVGVNRVEVHRQTDLRTADVMEFQSALSDLVRWAEEILPGYQAAGYRVVFNLTGGFKSVQGFLQTLATFYADETVYIFETATDLLRIPRLPVRLTVLEEVRDNLGTFRRLANGLTVSDRDLEGIAETLLLKLDGAVALSPWGELIWARTRAELYGDRVHPSPSPKIRFGQKFEPSVENLGGDRYELINKRLDQLACHLEKAEKPNPRSLDFKPLQGKPKQPSTHEMDAWSDLDAKRLFGHFEEDIFVLDELGKHL